MTVTDLTDPEFLEWVAKEYATPQDIERFTPFLKAMAEQQSYVWEACGREQCDGQPHDGYPRKHARPEQIPSEDDWNVTLFITGRRWGKTRSSAQWLRKRALEKVGSYAICAPTYGDVRDVCVEGGQREPWERRSGFLSVCAPSEIANYNRSLGEIRMSNGSKIKMLSADEPDRARGWGFNAAWCDELSSWRYPATWYETLLPAVSMDDKHRFVVSTTPKRNKLTRELIERAGRDSSVRLIIGKTSDNAANLGKGAVEELRRNMTHRMALQELEGLLLTDVPGAIATAQELDEGRVTEEAPYTRTLVSVDPAVTNTEDSDETGIIVGSLGVDGHVYGLEDCSFRGEVDDWARRAVLTALEQQAGMILYEDNQGGDSIGSVLKAAVEQVIREHTIDGVPDDVAKAARLLVLKPVRASKSKFDRALPLQLGIQQHRFHLVGVFPELEEQLTTFTADHKGPSPDRLDALCHLFNELTNTVPKRRLSFRG